MVVYSKHAAHTVDQQLHGLDTHNIKIEGASVSQSGDTTDQSAWNGNMTEIEHKYELLGLPWYKL